MTGTVNMPADQRRAIIKRAALKVAEERGVYHVTRRAVAEACEVPTSTETVKHYFTVAELRALASE